MAFGSPDGEKFRSGARRAGPARHLRPQLERRIGGVPLCERKTRPGFDQAADYCLGLGHDRYRERHPSAIAASECRLGGSSDHILPATSPPMSVRAISPGRRSKPSSSSRYEPKKGTILALQYNYVAPQHSQHYERLGISLRRRLHLGPIDPHPARLGANS